MNPIEFKNALDIIKRNDSMIELDEPPVLEDEMGYDYYNHKFNSKNVQYTFKEFDDLLETHEHFSFSQENGNKYFKTFIVNSEKQMEVDFTDINQHHLYYKNIEAVVGVAPEYINFTFKEIHENTTNEKYICAYEFVDYLKTLFDEYDIYLMRNYNHVTDFNLDSKDTYKQIDGYVNVCFLMVDKNSIDRIFGLEINVKEAKFIEGEKEYNILCFDYVTIVNLTNVSKTHLLEKFQKVRDEFDFYENSIKLAATFDIVVKKGENYFNKNIKLKDFKPNFNISTHYNGGESFLEWHEKFIYTSKVKKKGISIFHGPAGTGKTSYIKKLSYDLRTTHKFILIPAQMIIELCSPGVFQNFIMDNIIPIIDDGWKVAIVLEDAEEVLKCRTKHHNPYVSTILNLSDGIMGELYNFQLICTMNSSIGDIDAALLRPNRLISCKMFDYLNESEAIKLYKEISGKDIDKIDNNLLIDKDMLENDSYKRDAKRIEEGKYTVGEVYKLIESTDSKILNGFIDGKKNEKNTIGFNRN
jgi:hypothetical protein